MEIYFKLFEVLFPVFFVVGIGYFIGKKNPKLDTTFIANFGAYIGSPAIVFYSVTTTGLTFEIFASYFLYYFLAIIGFSAVGIIFLIFLRKDKIIIPRSNFIFLKDDKVVFLAKKDSISVVENIFRISSI